MRGFVRAGVKLMAITCLAFVPIAAYRVVVELAAGNALGALAALAFAPLGVFLAWALWPNADSVAEIYMDRGRRRKPDESWRAAQEASASARIEPEGTTRRAAVGGSAIAGVDPVALHAHLRAADAAMLDLARRNPDRPDLLWAAIGAWAAEEAAWVAGLPDDHRLRPFTSAYAAATSAAQAFAANMGDAIGRRDAAEIERLSAIGQDHLDQRFRLAFDAANAIAWA